MAICRKLSKIDACPDLVIKTKKAHAEGLERVQVTIEVRTHVKLLSLLLQTTVQVKSSA